MSDDTKATEDVFPDARDLKIAEQAAQIKNLEAKLEELETKLAKLEVLLASQAEAKSSKTPVFTENYSLDRNKTNEKKPPKKFTGRKPAEAKIDQIADTIKVFANGVDQASCVEHRTQCAWRIVDFDGRAVPLRRFSKEDRSDGSVGRLIRRHWRNGRLRGVQKHVH